MVRIPRERRTLDPRVLQLKIRVRAPKGTTREELLAAIEDAALTRVLAPGFTVHWIDWRKGEGGTANEGRITQALADELHAFYFALTAPETRVRVERVED